MPAAIPIAAAVFGGAMSANASSKASKAQVGAAREANALQKQISDEQIALQREQFNRSVELQEPFRQGGMAAQNQLMYWLGLSPTGRDATDPRIQSVRGRLAPQYTTSTTTAGLSGAELEAAVNAEVAKRGGSVSEFEIGAIREALGTGGSSQVERAGLDDAVRAELGGGAGGSGEFGSLMRDFSMADYEEDPGLAFRREQGEQGLTRGAAASGMLGSGRYLKDAMRFNSGLASQEYGNAYNRFQINRNNKLTPLQSLMGAGQTAAGTIGQAGQNFASGAGNALGAYGASAGNNITGAGNARAAGYLHTGNAMQNALNQGVSAYTNRGYAGGSGFGGSRFGAGINPNSGEYMGSLEF